MKHTHITLFLILPLFIFCISGCDNRTRVGKNETTDWTKHLKLPKAQFTPAAQLHILTWHYYIPQEVFDFFSKTYGTQIVPTYIHSNEEMFQLVQSHPDKYDLLTPSDYMVSKLIKNNLLYRLDHLNLPNIENLDEDLRRVPYDTGLRYSVPLFRTSLGIGFNIDYIVGIPRNWNYLVEQARNSYLVYRLGITKEMRFALGIALQLGGYSPNTTNPDEIAKARDLLIDTIKTCGLTFMSEENSDQEFINNNILLGVIWNGSAASALNQNSNIRFLLPEGKVMVTIDNAVINAQSKKIRTAELLINYLLYPQVMAQMTNYNYYPNSMSTSLPLVKRNIRTGPGFLFPEEEDRLFLKDLGPATKLYEEAWAQVLQTKAPETLVKLPLPKGGFFRGDPQMEDFTKDFIDEKQTNGQGAQ
nr:spermidine/putrescine ABC transporter substrate-binding protein [uncultured Desulfobulbus sp.]